MRRRPFLHDGRPPTILGAKRWQAHRRPILFQAGRRLHWHFSPIGANLTLHNRAENQMAKGQVKGNKEAKKPKAEKPKAEASAYKASQGKGGQAITLPGKKG